jgi:hypothetical protein
MRTLILFLIPLLATHIVTADDAPRAIPPIQTYSLVRLDGRLDHLAFDLEKDHVFVAAPGSSSVAVVDLKLGRMTYVLNNLPRPQGVSVASDGEHFLIACEGGGACRFCDRNLLKQVATRDLKTDADNTRYGPSAKRFWVGYGSGALAAFDDKTLDQVRDIPLPAHPESFQLETTGKRIFVNLPLVGQIAIVDREKGEVIGKWEPREAAGNYPMALDEEHHRLMIGCRKPSKVLILDTETGRTMASLDCVPEADDLFYDAISRQIIVTGSGGNFTLLKQRELDQYDPPRAIPTGDGARTSLLDSASGHLYIAVPHRGEQRAELRVYDIRKIP